MDISIVLGQGIAGSTLAWELHWAGHSVHLIDRCETVSASKIAAGLITPITGKRLTQVSDFEESRNIAEEFYKRVGSVTGTILLDKTPSERYFINDEEKDFFLAERKQKFTGEIEIITDHFSQPVGFRMLKAARLRVTDFLSATANYFLERGQFHQASVNLQQDIKLSQNGVQVLNLDLMGTRLFFCQGYQAERNPWFPDLPDAPARGEILKVRISDRNVASVVHKGCWLAPDLSPASANSESNYVLGATYDRENLLADTTDAGREELLNELKQITKEEVKVTGHFSAIRAGMRTRQPIVAIQSDYPQLGIMNGLGSRASLMAPAIAKKLIRMMSEKPTAKVLPEKMISVTKMAHSIVRRVLLAGDFAIDATAGNGHDTLFLAQSVGEDGRVLGIDVQQSAIEATAAKLETEKLTNASLVLEDHRSVLCQLFEQNKTAQAIMFNLGYLPGSGKTQTTMAQTTGEAISAGMKLLGPGGVMTVIAYRGHSGGREEAQVVDAIAKNPASENITVDIIPGSTTNEESPVLYVFRRNKQSSVV